MRVLFCLPTTALSGGVKVIFELANRLTIGGTEVHLFSFAGPPRWFALHAPLLEQRDLAAVDFDAYDFVVVSNAFFVPQVLPRVRAARVVLLCQDYESFHHASAGTRTYEDFVTPSPSLDEIYRLPIPLVAISRPVARLLQQHAGRSAYYLPMGIDRTVFHRLPAKVPGDRKRILFVGNYLMPYKGMADGILALRRLAGEMPVQLVMATQEGRSRAFFDDLPFAVELHFCPPETAMPAIMASCDVYCCTSWYEGLGLPALECFACGVAVVSTRTYGVMDYGIDGENLLLAAANDPGDLYRQLRRVLMDSGLAARLREGGARTVEAGYRWEDSVNRFREILQDIETSYAGPGVVSPEAMSAILDRLETTGVLTPIEIFRQYQQLAASLDLVIRELLATGPSPAGLEAVTRLRAAFGDRLGNPRAQYYDAFRAKYDFCGLLLALRDRPRFVDYLALVLQQSHHRASHAPPTLSEIRYPLD